MVDLNEKLIMLEKRIEALERAYFVRGGRLYSEGMKSKKVSLKPGDRDKC